MEEEINKAVEKVVRTKEEQAREREQLIKNIIYSELSYAERKEKLSTSTDETEIADLMKYIAQDESTIATWVMNYGITPEEVDAVRATVLDEISLQKEQEDLQRKADLEENIKALMLQVEEIPVKREKDVATITALQAEPTSIFFKK